MLGQIVHRLQPALDVELPINARQVVFDGLDAQPSLSGEALIVKTLQEEAQDLALAFGQPGGGRERTQNSSAAY